MKKTHPYWIARGVAVASAAIVAGITVWDPIWIVRGSFRPVLLQCAGGVGIVALLLMPDRVIASSQVRYRLTQAIALVCMATVINQMNWQGLIAPVFALDACRHRFKMKERIREVARLATTTDSTLSTEGAPSVEK